MVLESFSIASFLAYSCLSSSAMSFSMFFIFASKSIFGYFGTILKLDTFLAASSGFCLTVAFGIPLISF